MTKKVIKKEYVIDIYKEVEEDILEIKKKVVTVYKNKLIEKGYKFYVEFISKTPTSLDLTHLFIVKHLETDRWIFIDCCRNDSISYNGKEYKTFHTIDINKMSKDVNSYINYFGYNINSNNELVSITKNECEKIYNKTGVYFSSYRFKDEITLKKEYYIRDFSRKHKLDIFFNNLS